MGRFRTRCHRPRSRLFGRFDLSLKYVKRAFLPSPFLRRSDVHLWSRGFTRVCRRCCDVFYALVATQCCVMVCITFSTSPGRHHGYTDKNTETALFCVNVTLHPAKWLRQDGLHSVERPAKTNCAVMVVDLRRSRRSSHTPRLIVGLTV